MLQSHNIPTNKICSFSWKTDGVKVIPKEGVFEIDLPTQFSDIVFQIPLSHGKWYYEVTLLSEGECTQIGWANERMDIFTPVK